MKLSLLLEEQNLKLTQSFIHRPIRTLVAEWFPAASQQEQDIRSTLITQLVLQCSIYSLVRKNNRFDIKHYGSISNLIIRTIAIDLRFHGGVWVSLAITTSRQLRRYKSVGLGEIAVINDIANMFDEAGIKRSDKLAIMIFEQVKLAIDDANKFVKKTKDFVVNDQLSLLPEDSFEAYYK